MNEAQQVLALTDSIDLQTGVWLVVRYGFLLAFVLYVIFSVVVWQQINLMARTLNGLMELPLRITGMLLVVLGVLGLFWAYFTL